MTYSYRNQALIDLPMRFAQHDVGYQTGVQLLVDGDMEAAGVAAWTPNDSTLTKDTTAPLYGDSTQHLRITSTNNTFWAVQTILTAGWTYRMTGAARMVSGGAIPYVIELGAHLWIGEANTDWQYFDIIFTTTNIWIYLGSLSNHPGVVDFANVRVEKIEPRILNVGTAGALGDATFGNGNTPTRYPTKLNRKGYSTDGGDDFKGVADAYTSRNGHASLGVVVKLPDTAGVYGIATYEAGTTLGMAFLVVTNNIQFYCGGSSANNASFLPITPGVFHSLVGVYDGTNTYIYLDGVRGPAANIPLAPGITSSMRSSIFERRTGVQTCPAGTEIAQYSLWNFALSATQANDFHVEMMKKLGKI